MREWIAEEESSLKEFTDTHDPQASFFFDRLLKAREIRINGERAAAGSARVKAGDTVRYYLTREQEEKPAFLILYEDEKLLAIDKEDGVNSEAVYATLARERGKNAVYFIHRLDRNTRGAMIFAKDMESAEELKKAFQSRAIEKTYLAVLKNHFPADMLAADMPAAGGGKGAGAKGAGKNAAAGGTISAGAGGAGGGFIEKTAYLTKDPARAIVRISNKPQKGAESIATGFKIIKKKGDLALCEIALHTGKTHQIRAHSAYLGVPVLGDTKYGDKTLNQKYGKARQCLISKKITLHFSAASPLAYADKKSFVSKFDFAAEGF